MIRAATPQDAPAIDAMLRALSEHVGALDAHRGDAEGLRRDWDMFEVAIAGDASTPSGMILYFKYYSTTRGMPGVYVQDVYVAPESRGSGLGRALLAHAARHAASHWGARFMMLAVDRDNSGAMAFYDSLGFAAKPNDLPHALDGVGFSTLLAEDSV